MAGVAIEVIGKVVARRVKARFDAISPDEQRKEQELVYKVEVRRS